MAQSPPTRPRRRGRQAAVLAAVLLALWLLTRYDLALVLWLAHYPVQPWAVLVDGLLRAGSVAGVPAITVLLFALPTLLHLTAPRPARGTPSSAPGAGSGEVSGHPASKGRLVTRLRRWRAASGYLMTAGWCGGVSIMVADRLLARPAPSAVLSGKAGFTPWFAAQFGAPGLPVMGSAAGHAGAMALLLAYALLLRRAGRMDSARVVGAAALLLSALAALAGMSLQTAWPFTSAFTALLGLAVPLWLYGLRFAEAPQGLTGEWDDEPSPLLDARVTARGGDPWALHPVTQGHWPIRFSIAYLGLGVAVLLMAGGLRGAPGATWLHIGVGLLALLFFGRRLRRLLRPLSWGPLEE